MSNSSGHKYRSLSKLWFSLGVPQVLGVMFCRGSKRDHDPDRHPYKVYFRARKLPYSGIKIRMFVYVVQDLRKILMGTTILRDSQGPNNLGTGYKLSLREKVDALFVAEAYERFQFI